MPWKSLTWATKVCRIEKCTDVSAGRAFPFHDSKRSQIFSRLNGVTFQMAVLFRPQRGHILFAKRYSPIDLLPIGLLRCFIYIYIYIYIYSDSSSDNAIRLRAKKILQKAAMLFLILQKISSSKAAFSKQCKLLLGTKVVLSSLVCAPTTLLLPTAGN